MLRNSTMTLKEDADFQRDKIREEFQKMIDSSGVDFKTVDEFVLWLSGFDGQDALFKMIYFGSWSLIDRRIIDNHTRNHSYRGGQW